MAAEPFGDEFIYLTYTKNCPVDANAYCGNTAFNGFAAVTCLILPPWPRMRAG